MGEWAVPQRGLTKALMLVDPMDNCGQAGIPVSFSTDGCGPQGPHGVANEYTS